jgi:predicted amidophosphoribosyltransferase
MLALPTPWRHWLQRQQHRCDLAMRAPRCMHCFQQTASWLCPSCQAEWGKPQLVHVWPQLNTYIYGLQPLTGLIKHRLYGAKFYANTDHRWWCTALMASGIAQCLPPSPIPLTLVTLPGRAHAENKHAHHWMHDLSSYLSLDTGHSTLTLAWQRTTQPQHTRPHATARWHNMEQALSVPQNQPMPTGRVCLLDDITTTGASLYNAAMALRQAGYTKPIVGLTLGFVPDPAQRHPNSPTTAHGQCQPVTRQLTDPAFDALWPTPRDALRPHRWAEDPLPHWPPQTSPTPIPLGHGPVTPPAR